MKLLFVRTDLIRKVYGVNEKAGETFGLSHWLTLILVTPLLETYHQKTLLKKKCIHAVGLKPITF